MVGLDSVQLELGPHHPQGSLVIPVWNIAMLYPKPFIQDNWSCQTGQSPQPVPLPPLRCTERCPQILWGSRRPSSSPERVEGKAFCSLSCSPLVCIAPSHSIKKAPPRQGWFENEVLIRMRLPYSRLFQPLCSRTHSQVNFSPYFCPLSGAPLGRAERP